MTDIELREREVQIARYRCLEREVTDPLAVHLLHAIIEELEADLRGNSGTGTPEDRGRDR